MRLPAACTALILSLACAPALAGPQSAGSLDLSLPEGAAYRNDPPGTWYGDTSGVPAAPPEEAAAPPRRAACPTAPDGSERDLTGSVAAGIGYSSRLGNSNWQSATFNYCKEYSGDGGSPRSVNLQLNIGTFDGPGYGPLMGPPPGAWPRGYWGR